MRWPSGERATLATERKRERSVLASPCAELRGPKRQATASQNIRHHTAGRIDPPLALHVVTPARHSRPLRGWGQMHGKRFLSSRVYKEQLPVDAQQEVA